MWFRLDAETKENLEVNNNFNEHPPNIPVKYLGPTQNIWLSKYRITWR